MDHTRVARIEIGHDTITMDGATTYRAAVAVAAWQRRHPEGTRLPKWTAYGVDGADVTDEVQAEDIDDQSVSDYMEDGL